MFVHCEYSNVNLSDSNLTEVFLFVVFSVSYFIVKQLFVYNISMKCCEICEIQEDPNKQDHPENPQGKLMTIKGRIFCQSCILLGMDALRHWHGTLEKDDSTPVEVNGQTFCESHIIRGVDTLKEDLEAFLSRIPKDN